MEIKDQLITGKAYCYSCREFFEGRGYIETKEIGYRTFRETFYLDCPKCNKTLSKQGKKWKRKDWGL